MSSQNKPSIDSLVSAISNGLNAAQNQDLLQKISDDLDKVFTQVNTGPLPANSAINLTDIRAAAITGVIARANLPPEIAYIDVANIFSQDQTVQKALATVFVKVVAATQFGRVEAVANGRTLFSSNLFFNGAYATDVGDGSGIEFNGALVQLRQRIGGVDFVEIEVDPARIIKFGRPSNVVGAGADDIVLANNKNVRGANNAGTTTYRMLSIDTNDTLLLGNGYNGDLFPKIIAVVAGSLPASGSGATFDGIVCIDKTNHRLCFYEGGLRYYLAGTAF